MPTRTVSHRAARTLTIVRALIAAVAAVVVTFVQNRPGEFAAAAHQGFLAAMVVYFIVETIVRGLDAKRVLLGVIHIVGVLLIFMLPGTADARFHMTLLIWAAAAGIVELVGGLIGRRRGSDDARDNLTVGVLTCLLALAALIVSPEYTLDYFVKDAGQSFTLTGTIVGVGFFGGWAAIVAVYLGIGAFSPTPATTVTKDAA
jgi:uncharacterized membrane protein HdeD (DUF308 family)